MIVKAHKSDGTSQVEVHPSLDSILFVAKYLMLRDDVKSVEMIK